SFSTVATWWIRAAIQNSALGADDCADMPPSAKRKLYRIQQTERALLESGQEVSDAAIARALKLSEVTVQRLRAIAPNAMLPTASLDEIVGDGDTTLGELIADENSVDPDASVQHNQMKRALSLALSSLDERQRVVLSMRFGLVDDQEVTLQDLADRYGISCERVRQIEIRALAKLAAGPHAQLLRSILQA
ncbi:MAG: sigma-70 family RNA polymerase sigma factor, partial [Cyanobacteria bacterium SZAS LIN-5]|nr:sigma-70 family RNA polymerase sigma factor [Cyanobacteria bacterium SZAS LIN-5]